jgi:hypothetical protein
MSPDGDLRFTPENDSQPPFFGISRYNIFLPHNPWLHRDLIGKQSIFGF